MDWNPDDRNRFLRQLDDARRKLQVVYAIVLIAALALLLAFVGFALWKSRGTPKDPLGLLLGGIVLLMVVGWIVGQLRAVYLDLPPPPGKIVPGDFGPNQGLQIESHSEPGRKEFKLSVGSPPAEPGHQESFSVTIPLGQSSIAAAELPAAQLPDDAALNTAEALLQEGFDLERACRYVNPNYGTWDPPRQRAYALYLQTKLDERKKAQT
jgi:hypothetical protein